MWCRVSEANILTHGRDMFQGFYTPADAVVVGGMPELTIQGDRSGRQNRSLGNGLLHRMWEDAEGKKGNLCIYEIMRYIDECMDRQAFDRLEKAHQIQAYASELRDYSK